MRFKNGDIVVSKFYKIQVTKNAPHSGKFDGKVLEFYDKKCKYRVGNKVSNRWCINYKLFTEEKEHELW